MKLKIGSKLPEEVFFHLDEQNNVKKIKTSEIFKNQKIILLGMPGAFTKTCSSIHLPGFVKNYDEALKKALTK